MLTTYQIDEDTKIRVGYPDGHIEVDVKLPFPFSVLQSKATRSLSSEAVLRSVPAMTQALRVIRELKGKKR